MHHLSSCRTGESSWTTTYDRDARVTMENCPHRFLWSTIIVWIYFSGGRYRYSRIPEVEIVHSTRASTVIPKLDKMFSVHGIPDTIISDNGPHFNGTEYVLYVKALGIHAKFWTPYWPQGNATVERFMRPFGKALKTATLKGRPWKQELNRVLLQYRTTPHCTTGVPHQNCCLTEWWKENYQW